MKPLLNFLGFLAIALFFCGGALYTWTTPDPGVVMPHAPILNR